MDVFLIRHGQSLWNAHKQYDPVVVDADIPLTDEGFDEVERADGFLYGFLGAYYGDSLNYNNTHVFVSPLLRAKQTYNNLSSLSKFPCDTDELLVEINAGLLDFYPPEKVKEECGLLYDYWDTCFKSNAYFARFPNGESPFDVSMRVRMFIEKLNKLKRDGCKAVFLISHGTWLLVFQKMWLGETVEWYNSSKRMGTANVILINSDLKSRYVLGYDESKN